METISRLSKLLSLVLVIGIFSLYKLWRRGGVAL